MSTTERLRIAILDDYERTKFFVDYYELEKKLGGKGASEKTAKLIYEAINP